MKAQRDTTWGTTLGISLFAATISINANAECPQNLPTNLLQDCIVIEGSGSNFPHPDYAHMAAYEAWLAEQAQSVQPAAGQPASIAGNTGATSE